MRKNTKNDLNSSSQFQKRRSRSHYLQNFRTVVEMAYINQKKDEMPQNWSPFMAKTSFSMEKKLEGKLLEQMEKTLIIHEKNEIFAQKEYQVMFILTFYCFLSISQYFNEIF